MCPRTDLVLRDPNEFYTSDCHDCGSVVEFFADDLIQNCADCGSLQYNPRMVDDWEQPRPMAKAS